MSNWLGKTIGFTPLVKVRMAPNQPFPPYKTQRKKSVQLLELFSFISNFIIIIFPFCVSMFHVLLPLVSGKKKRTTKPIQQKEEGSRTLRVSVSRQQLKRNPRGKKRKISFKDLLGGYLRRD